MPSPSLLEVFNHVALPPRLPSREDSDSVSIAEHITQRLLDASNKLRQHANIPFKKEWASVYRSLRTCKELNVGGRLNKESLLRAFEELRDEDVLILHITEQNAALLIRQHKFPQDEPAILFEVFEASAKSRNILAANALLWDFPGSGVSLPASIFSKSTFRIELAEFLDKASIEAIKTFLAHNKKAESIIIESRDTACPALISGVGMTLLLGSGGTRVHSPSLQKRVRDDVNWSRGSEKPWRRCPFWLVLRVGIQRHLCTLLGADSGKACYKFLMCTTMAMLLDDATHHIDLELLYHLKTKLCGRMIKLAAMRSEAPAGLRPTYESLFAELAPSLYLSAEAVEKYIGNAIEELKTSRQRSIPQVPQRASEQDLVLRLSVSERRLTKILEEPLFSRVSYEPVDSEEMIEKFSNPSTAFSDRYLELSENESEL